jgi:hypothetical protein
MILWSLINRTMKTLFVLSTKVFIVASRPRWIESVLVSCRSGDTECRFTSGDVTALVLRLFSDQHPLDQVECEALKNVAEHFTAESLVPAQLEYRQGAAARHLAARAASSGQHAFFYA